ncbi:MAG: PA domain-containing protein [Bacteroidota bacterium]
MLRANLLLALLLLPSAVFAQVVGKTNAELEVAGVEYAVVATQNFGAQFKAGAPFGPYEIVQAVDEAGEGTTLDGCDPITNPDEVAGKIALISRGTCPFVTKAENAANAGAVAYIVYMDEREGQDGEGLVNMGGDCGPDVCSVPGVFMSRRDYKSILADVEAGAEGTIFNDFHPPPFGGVDTGIINVPLYDNGFFGAREDLTQTPFGERPLTYNGFTPLRVGTVLVGIDGTVATNPYAGTSEYVRSGTVLTGTFNGDPAAQASFRSEQLGVGVTNLVYGPVGAPHLFFQLSVSSTTGTEIPDVYVGLFADWNIADDEADTGADDLGGYYERLSYYGDIYMPYVFDDDQAQFYGLLPAVGLSSAELRPAGYATDVDVADDAQLFAGLTTRLPPSEQEQERATVIGQGPYTLPADGTPVVATFALVAATSLAELIDHAEATFPPVVASEEEPIADPYRLASVYPNPVSTTATVGFTLPTSEDAHVEVFDLLGRRVATLADGLRAAGEHRVTLNAAGLPSGVYVVRLSTPSATLTERVTVVR